MVVGDSVADDAVVDVAGEVASVASGVLAGAAWDEAVEPVTRLLSLAHDVTDKAAAASTARAVWRTRPSLEM